MGERLYSLIEHRGGRGGALRTPVGIVLRVDDGFLFKVAETAVAPNGDAVRTAMAARALVARLRRENPRTDADLEIFIAKEANEIRLAMPKRMTMAGPPDLVLDFLFDEVFGPSTGTIPPACVSMRAFTTVAAAMETPTSCEIEGTFVLSTAAFASSGGFTITSAAGTNVTLGFKAARDAPVPRVESPLSTGTTLLKAA